MKLNFIGIILEKVVGKCLRDAQKKVGIQGLLLEYIIHIRAGAIYLACQPRRSTFLASHLLFYYLTYMYHKRRNCLLQISN